MPNLSKLPAWAGDEFVHVVVETPRGARAKLTFDPELKEELEKFFVATDELEAKTLKFLGWQGPAEAKKLVRRCERVFKRKN